MIWEFVGIHLAGGLTTGHESPQTASSRCWEVIRIRPPSHAGPNRCRGSNLLPACPLNSTTLAATSFIHQSIRWCPRSAAPQRGMVENPAPQGDRQALWPVAPHQEVRTDKNTGKIKGSDQPSVSVSPHTAFMELAFAPSV